MISLIIGIIAFLLGLFCLIKPDNFLLPYLQFGGVVNAKSYIQKKGKTKQLLIWMRFFGLVALIIGIVFIIPHESTIYKGNIPQGTFKAMIGNNEIFTNGPDIVNVSASESTDIRSDLCFYENKTNEYFCPFRLGFTISDKAAERQAKATAGLDIIKEGELEFLSENLTLYFKGNKLDDIRISSDMKGLKSKDIQISGSGNGKTKEEAIKDASQKYTELVNVLSDIPSTS